MLPHPARSHFQAISLQVFFSCMAWYRATAAWPTCAAIWRGRNETLSTSAHFALYIRPFRQLNTLLKKIYIKYIHLPNSHGQFHIHNKNHLEHHIFIPFFLRRWTRQMHSETDRRGQFALMWLYKCVINNRPHFLVC